MDCVAEAMLQTLGGGGANAFEERGGEWTKERKPNIRQHEYTQSDSNNARFGEGFVSVNCCMALNMMPLM